MTHIEQPAPEAFGKKRSAWQGRAEIAAYQKQADVEQASQVVAQAYEELAEHGGAEPEEFTKANQLRKRIEAAEAHRTMSAEHGLGNEAIDVTLEIQRMEKQLVELIQVWQTQRAQQK